MKENHTNRRAVLICRIANERVVQFDSSRSFAREKTTWCVDALIIAGDSQSDPRISFKQVAVIERADSFI